MGGLEFVMNVADTKLPSDRNHRSGIRPMSQCFTCREAPFAWVRIGMIRRKRRPIAFQ